MGEFSQENINGFQLTQEGSIQSFWVEAEVKSKQGKQKPSSFELEVIT